MEEKEHKALVACAVEVSREGSGRVRLRSIPSEEAKSFESFVEKNVSKATTLRTDGWRGYAGRRV